ncbi:eCIS core domain-containing protein [Dapis sp. BLCC M229]|uniref:eCIS core domain-containing protein n=1 Tax=Dapis sp. BLCC M229 TaxID=3400188 RepID=UPI003CE89C73
MSHDFVKPKKIGGLDTNTHAGQKSPFASRPFLATPRSLPQPQDIQTMRERAARYQAANPHLYGTPAQPQTVQRQTSETEEESLQMKANESVQRQPEQPDLQTLIRQRAARVDTPLQRMMKVQMAEAQRLKQQEDEKLQTKSELTVQREIMPEVEEENLQMQSEPILQRDELAEEEEDKNLQMQSEATVQLKSQDSEQEQAGVQTKLTIGQPGDKYEQEADNMAAKVMSMPEPTVQNVQRQEIGEKEETLQEKPVVDGITPVVQRQISETQQQDGGSQGLESQLSGEKGGGHPLSDEVRGFMEPRFGADFSDVRVHTGSAAVQMNQQLGAQAFTHGNDVYYGKGKAPGKDALTAHELAHKIQQTGSSGLRIQGFFWDNDENEKESDSDSSEGLFDWVSDVASSVTDTTSNAWDTASDFASETWDATTDTASDVWSNVTDTASDVANTASDTWNQATDLASDTWDKTTDTASDTWNQARDFASDTWNTTKNTASDVWSNVTDTTSDTWNGISDFTSDTWDAGQDFYRENKEKIHTTLDVAGLFPIIGPVADLTNAGLYAASGNWSNAALSGVAAIPGIGDAMGLAGKGAKAASTSKFIPKAGKTIKNKVGQVGKNLENIHQGFENPLVKSVLKGPATLVGEYAANTLVKGNGAKAWLKKQALKQLTIQSVKQGAGAIFGGAGESIAGGIKGETSKQKFQRIRDSKTWNDLANVASETASDAANTASETWNQATDLASDNWDKTTEAVSEGWDWTKQKAEEITG